LGGELICQRGSVVSPARIHPQFPLWAEKVFQFLKSDPGVPKNALKEHFLLEKIN
jgi:hypothetical protein